MEKIYSKHLENYIYSMSSKLSIKSMVNKKYIIFNNKYYFIKNISLYNLSLFYIIFIYGAKLRYNLLYICATVFSNDLIPSYFLIKQKLVYNK